MDAAAEIDEHIFTSAPRPAQAPAGEGKLPTGRLTAHSLLHIAVTGVQLPIGVYLPAIYAQQYGISLTALGMIFLAERNRRQNRPLSRRLVPLGRRWPLGLAGLAAGRLTPGDQVAAL